MSKHMPEPWDVEIATFNGRKYYSIIKGPTHWATEDAEANAKLIAAAPELLAALKFVAEVNHWGHGGLSDIRACDADSCITACTAINKAEGK